MVVCSVHIQTHIGIIQTAREVLEVAKSNRGPYGFGQSNLTREGTILHQLRSIEILSPEVGLRSLDVMTLVCGDRFGNRIVIVDLLQRSIAANTYGLDLCISLVVVDIETATPRGHDDIVTHISRLDASIFTTPAHDRSRGSKPTFEDFIPANELLAVCSKHLLCTANDVALKLMFVFQAFVLDTLLAVGTLLPASLRAFVTPNVEVLPRK